MSDLLQAEDALARAILAARSTTDEWKGFGRAIDPTDWDRTLAKRILIAGDVSEPAPPKPGCECVLGHRNHVAYHVPTCPWRIARLEAAG